MTCSTSAEKRVLIRLSVFSGGFTFEAAVAVVADEMVDEAKVSDCVWELRSKSMIAAHGQESRLRLLDTTRAFASRDWPRAMNRTSFAGATPFTSATCSNRALQWICREGPGRLGSRSTISEPP